MHSGEMDGAQFFNLLLEKRGYNPTSLARAIGVKSAQSQFHRVKTGVIQMPTSRTNINAAAAVLEVDPLAFYDGDVADREWARISATGPLSTRDPVSAGIGMRLASAREGLKLSVHAVAEALRTAPAAIESWESGKNLPDAHTLRSICKLYNVSADSILWEDSLSPEAMQIAVDFDHLTDAQRRTFRAVWDAFIRQGVGDEDVEGRMEITKAFKERADQSR